MTDNRGTLLTVYFLFLVGIWSESGAANNLGFSISDSLPTSNLELAFGESLQPLLFAQASAGPENSENWESSKPPTDQFDWIQTTSGEWLKGQLKVLYTDQLEFDSDEFGLQTLDWEDVAQLLSHGKMRVSIDSPGGPRVFDGVINADGEKVTIVSSAGMEEFDRSMLISITPGADREQDNWLAKISFGFNFSRGNSEQTDLILKLNIKRRTPENRFVVDYLGNFSKARDIKTVDNHRLNTFYDIFAAREYFWRPLFFEYYRDPFQNIDSRTTIGIGGGYHIIDTPRSTWNVTGGPAYRANRYVSVAPGDSVSVNTPALVIGTFYDTTLTKTVDFNTRYNFSIVNQDSGTYTHHAVATFEIEVTSILDFDVTLIWDRTKDPQTRSDGSVPKQDDFQLLLTLGVDM
jgi:putative salt-induced outer membrane protein YdiY